MMVLNSVAASGALDPKNFSKAGPLYIPPPVAKAPTSSPTPAELSNLQNQSALKLGSDGKPVRPTQFDFTSNAYVTWAAQGQNLQSLLNTNVTVPFRDKFPALGG